MSVDALTPVNTIVHLKRKVVFVHFAVVFFTIDV